MPNTTLTKPKGQNMKAYKGFNKDMTCRGFQYKEGGEYETNKAELCEAGFHACENPLDCLGYYEPDKSVYHEVELGGEIDRRSDGVSKVAATKIKIGAKLNIAGIVKGAIDFVMSKVKATSGDWANAATSGDLAHAATSGYGAHAATSGYGANAATSGDRANAEVKGKDSIAAVLGCNCKARGGLGCWLVLTERDEDWHILGVKAIRIDGKKYKADTWYTLRDGKVVETKEDNNE